MARFSYIASIVASALLFLATSAAPVELSIPPPVAEFIQQPSLQMTSPDMASLLPTPAEDMPAESPAMEMTSPSPEPRNEGCVAVEHLEGYALQHAQHFKRRVLCADGFCATPNHAIIVDGATTSMRQLCAGGWACVETEKLVNNLNLFVNRRARVSARIVVTPYDVRFPRWCAWVAQTLECAWNTLRNMPVEFFSVLALVAVSLHSQRFAGLISYLAVLSNTRRKSKLQ